MLMLITITINEHYNMYADGDSDGENNTCHVGVADENDDGDDDDDADDDDHNDDDNDDGDADDVHDER